MKDGRTDDQEILVRQINAKKKILGVEKKVKDGRTDDQDILVRQINAKKKILGVEKRMKRKECQ